MNESVKYVQAYKKLSDDYLAQAQAYDNLNRLYMESVKRADAAEAYVQALEEVCDSEQLKCAQSSARQQGGAK